MTKLYYTDSAAKQTFIERVVVFGADTVYVAGVANRRPQIGHIMWGRRAA